MHFYAFLAFWSLTVISHSLSKKGKEQELACKFVVQLLKFYRAARVSHLIKAFFQNMQMKKGKSVS